MDKRYQVFVSSTYTDLIEERRLITETLLKMNCIPAGMEMFPASDEAQFEFIKRVLNDCDYYLLIIGGRYGTLVEETGISYTEREYDYAVEQGKNVVALLHRNPESIPRGKSEGTATAQKKLEAFRNKASKGRMVSFWDDSKGLAGEVALAMINAINQFPQIGWIRGNQAASNDLLNEINELHKKNSELARQVAEYDHDPPVPEDLAELGDLFRINGKSTTTDRYGSTSRSWHKEVSWLKLFVAISPFLTHSKSDTYVRRVIIENLMGSSTVSKKTMDEQDFQTIKLQLQAYKLVKVRYTETRDGSWTDFWSLTPSGHARMVEMRILKKGETETKL